MSRSRSFAADVVLDASHITRERPDLAGVGIASDLVTAVASNA